MSKQNCPNHAKFISSCKKANSFLNELRKKELPLTDIVKGLTALLPAFERIIKETELTNYSGLIEQQRIFKLKRK